MLVHPQPGLSGGDTGAVQLRDSQLPFFDQLRRLAVSLFGAVDLEEYRALVSGCSRDVCRAGLGRYTLSRGKRLGFERQGNVPWSAILRSRLDEMRNDEFTSPEVTIDSDDASSLPSALKILADMMWQAGGLEETPNTKDGVWNPFLNR